MTDQEIESSKLVIIGQRLAFEELNLDDPIGIGNLTQMDLICCETLEVADYSSYQFIRQVCLETINKYQ